MVDYLFQKSIELLFSKRLLAELGGGAEAATAEAREGAEDEIQIEIHTLAEFYSEAETHEFRAMRRIGADIISKHMEISGAPEDIDDDIETLRNEFISKHPRIDPVILDDYVGSILGIEGEVSKIAGEPVIRGVLEDLARGELVDKESFCLLVSKLDLRTFGPETTIQQRNYREILIAILDQVRGTQKAWSYLSYLFNSIENYADKTSFIAYARTYGMISVQEMQHVMLDAKENTMEISKDVQEKIANLMMQIQERNEFPDLVAKLHQLLIVERLPEDSDEVTKIYMRLAEMNYDLDLVAAMVTRAAFEEVEAKLETDFECRNDLNQNLDVMMESLDGVGVWTPELKKLFLLEGSSSSLIASGLLIESRSMAESMKDHIGLSVFTYIRDNFDQLSPGEVSRYLKAYKSLPVTYRQIERQLNEGVYPIDPAILTELNNYNRSFVEMGVPAAEQMQVMADNLNKLPVIEAELDTELKDLLNSNPYPSTAEVEAILSKYRDKYGLNLQRMIDRELLNTNIAEAEIGRALANGIIALSPSGIGLGVLGARYQNARDFEDVKISMDYHRLGNVYQSCLGFVEDLLAEAAFFGQLPKKKQEELELRLRELKQIADNTGLKDMSMQTIGGFLIAIHDNKNELVLSDIYEGLEKYEKQVEQVAGASYDLSLEEIRGQVSGELSRIESFISPHDVSQLQQKMEEIRSSNMSEEEKIAAYTELLSKYQESYSVTYNVNFEEGTLVRQNTIYNCRNTLMRQMSWTGLLNAGMGLWGFLTFLVNSVAALGNLVTTGAIHGDWESAIDNAIKNAPYAALGLTTLGTSKANINSQGDEKWLSRAQDYTALADHIGGDAFSKERQEAQQASEEAPEMAISDGKRIALQILGARHRDKKEGDRMAYVFMEGVHKNNLFNRNDTFITSLGYKDLGMEGANEDQASKNLAQLLAANYENRTYEQWLVQLKTNKDEVVLAMVDIIKYASMPSKWSWSRLSKSASKCVDIYLPLEERATYVNEDE